MLEIKTDYKSKEKRIRVVRKAKDGKAYSCLYIKRGDKLRIITAWPAGRKRTRQFENTYGVENINEQLFGKQKTIYERIQSMTKDIDDLPIDKEFWRKEMPASKILFAYSFFKHEHDLNSDLEKFGRKELFKILEKKYGSIDLGDGVTAVHYYPVK